MPLRSRGRARKKRGRVRLGNGRERAKQAIALAVRSGGEVQVRRGTGAAAVSDRQAPQAVDEIGFPFASTRDPADGAGGEVERC